MPQWRTSSAETFQPSQEATGETSSPGVPTNHTSCWGSEEPVSVPRPERVAPADDTHHIDGGSGSSFLKRRSPNRYTLFVRTLCRCFWSEVEYNGQQNCKFPPALRVWMGATRSNYFLWKFVKCKKLDHNRDLEIIKPVQHVEVDWEVIIMRNSFYHLNIAKDIWGSL